MLISFRVANFRSIKERKEFSLLPSALQDSSETLVSCSAAPNGKLLPAAIIYGPNASGKSGFVEALRWMRSAVLYSHSQGKPSGGVPRTPFALDPQCLNMPTELDIDFVVDGIRYNYGFEANDEVFQREWLYTYPIKRQLLFERQGMDFEFGRALKGRNRVIADLTRTNSLFLSTASQNAHDELLKISGFFRQMAIVGDTQRQSRNNLFDEEMPDIDRRAIDFLSRLGTGVVDYRISEREIPREVREVMEQLDTMRTKLSGGETTSSPSSEQPLKRKTLELAHKEVGGSLIYWGLNRESEGTRRLLELLRPMLSALDEGSLLIIDELDASLHTQACEALLLLFLSAETNPKGAQLVATTHDTNLLQCRVLRRDQIWFTEKNQQGATDLYPLTDFRTRKGDRLERGYLQGRYGAVPFAGTIPSFQDAS